MTWYESSIGCTIDSYMKTNKPKYAVVCFGTLEDNKKNLKVLHNDNIDFVSFSYIPNKSVDISQNYIMIYILKFRTKRIYQSRKNKWFRDKFSFKYYRYYKETEAEECYQ